MRYKERVTGANDFIFLLPIDARGETIGFPMGNERQKIAIQLLDKAKSFICLLDCIE